MHPPRWQWTLGVVLAGTAAVWADPTTGGGTQWGPGTQTSEFQLAHGQAVRDVFTEQTWFDLFGYAGRGPEVLVNDSDDAASLRYALRRLSEDAASGFQQNLEP